MSLYSFQFIPLNSIVKIRIHPAHSFKICKDWAISEKLLSTPAIVEDIIKQISSFLKFPSISLTHFNSNQKIFLENLIKKLSFKLTRKEEDELSNEESEFMKKALEIFLTESSTSGLTFDEENKKVGDLIPETQKKAIISVKFNILRGFSNLKTEKGEKFESDKPTSVVCQEHHEKATHFSENFGKLVIGFDMFLGAEAEAVDSPQDEDILRFLKELQRKFGEFDEKYSEFKKKIDEGFEFFDSFEEKSLECSRSGTEKIKLNIGGKIFTTIRESLTSEKDTFFSALLSDHFDQKPDEDGEFFIDRDNTFFHLILNHLRGIDIVQFLKRMSEEETDLLKGEVEFYCIKSLIETLKTKLSESLIIGDDAQKQGILKNFVEQTIGKTHLWEWKFLYRASRDGFGAKDFHSRCDSANRTLVIIKSTNGSIFGGFTTKRWNSASYAYARDEKAFIFSLLCATQPNRDPKSFSPTFRPECAIFCYQNYGPIFGGGGDIWISNASNSNNYSYTNLNDTYDASLRRNEEARTYLCGSFNFQISEIEVYTM